MNTDAARLQRRVRKSICVHPCSSVASPSFHLDPHTGRGERSASAVTDATEPHPAYVIVGVSHRTGTAALRERLSADEAGQTELLAALRVAGLHQALVLSTCDRTELHAIADDPTTAATAMRDILARQGRVTAADIAAQGYELVGDAALRQLFAVASSLDSVVV